MPGFQSTRLVTEGALEPFFFLYTDDSIQGNPETCKQSSIMLNYEVKNSVYYKKFAKIYNNKCAYCGAILGLLPIESFEIDHFLNEASFPNTTEGRIEAGRMHNLTWSCVSCNRGKRGITIKPPYDILLNVDNGNIATVFRRDKEYYIQICDTYKNDEFVRKFYEALHLGYETRRLDYLCLQLEGRYQAEKNEKRKIKLGESLSILLKKRNHMTITGRKL